MDAEMQNRMGAAARERGPMIRIKRSPTADSTCDYAKVSRETLAQSTEQHIDDVGNGIFFIQARLQRARMLHDLDKLTALDQFHADFVTGFEQHSWWDNHRKITRHHLQEPDGVPADVNLVDVLEMIVDCVMAGMARSGSVYEVKIDPDVLMAAFRNTVELLKANVEVEG
jgi:hypothetical protein